MMRPGERTNACSWQCTVHGNNQYENFTGTSTKEVLHPMCYRLIAQFMSYIKKLFVFKLVYIYMQQFESSFEHVHVNRFIKIININF